MAIEGRAVLETLAIRFPQLYIAPAEGAQEAHRRASGQGIVPEGANLDHFASTSHDELREVDTPAGPVEVVFLQNRADFETFLQIIGHKSQPVPIAPTLGGVTYFGLADWGKVHRAYGSYVASGGEDWPSEFARLAKQPGAFRSELVAISEGPYSNVSAEDAGFDQDAWLGASREIRLHHECAHVVCRRKLPQSVLPVWDEVVADVAGLASACGRYDAALAMRFLGVTANGYAGGRLAEYLDEEQSSRIHDVARQVAAACLHIEQTATEANLAHPFDYALELKSAPLIGF